MVLVYRQTWVKTMTDNPDTKPANNRRSFLQKTGGLAASLTAVGGLASTATAGSGQSQGTDEAGITNAVQNLTEQGKFEQAKRLLDNHDVQYDHDHVSVVVPSGGSSDDVSSQEVFNEDKSTFDFFGYAVSKPLYTIELRWDLHPRYPESDCPRPNDGTGISWSDFHWEYEPGSDNLSEYCEDIDPNPEGTIAEWDDRTAYAGNGDTKGHHIIGLEKQQSGVHTVYGHYIHSYTNYCGAASMSFGIGAGSLSVSASSGSGVASWKMTPRTIEI